VAATATTTLAVLFIIEEVFILNRFDVYIYQTDLPSLSPNAPLTNSFIPADFLQP
jgi:hypothetical protein